MIPRVRKLPPLPLPGSVYRLYIKPYMHEREIRAATQKEVTYINQAGEEHTCKLRDWLVWEKRSVLIREGRAVASAAPREVAE